ncbi:11 kDa late embryogenesis abundant protein [Juglans microcarpa x Juglans regia]|uniref:11 kDa late embryogenesis abundant protein n=1 Tax=Juglans microcarpa x Juglans regia TaxID=2249226 RepID=UPI001B7F4A22|nr:11 kDa late embryogenesis abundant protein [Juglans microcarpa x Juglans regia]
MQTGKNAAASAKEKAANVAASAKSGMEKAKASAQEKVEKMTAHDPVEKEMATEKEEAIKQQAELEKQEARMHNAANKQAERGGALGGGYATTGTEGVVESHPVGIDKGSGRTTAQNPRVEGTGPTYGTGGTYR